MLLDQGVFTTESLGGKTGSLPHSPHRHSCEAVVPDFRVNFRGGRRPRIEHDPRLCLFDEDLRFRSAALEGLVQFPRRQASSPLAGREPVGEPMDMSETISPRALGYHESFSAN
jgi:hypothetical protein